MEKSFVDPNIAFWRNTKVLHGDSLRSFLNDRLSPAGDLQDLVLIDLSLGALEPHSMAKECCKQLNLDFKILSVDCGKGMSALNIDRQGFGHLGRLITYDNAEHVAAALRANRQLKILINLPAAECQWEEEDVWFINELHHLLDHTNWLVFAVNTLAINLPNDYAIDWTVDQRALFEECILDATLSHFPGLLSTEFLENEQAIARLNKSKNIWRLADGRYFLSIRKKYDPEKLLLKFSFDQIKQIIRKKPWFRFYWPPGLKNIPCNPKVCYRLATQAFNEGVVQHELRIARWISGQNWGVERQTKYQLILVFIYLNTQQYELLSQLEIKAAYLGKSSQRILWNRKGYGLVFCNNLKEALMCFDQADAIVADESKGQDIRTLFRLNIKSLALLKIKDKNGAMRLQKELEDRLANYPHDVFHLACINALNIGRLYIRMGPSGIALDYIYKFIAMNQGAASDSYLIIGSHYLTKIYREQGRFEKALNEWLKILLLWVSIGSLGSLSKRSYRRFTSSIDQSDYQIVEAVSEKMIAELKDLGEECGYRFDHTIAHAPDFVRPQPLMPEALRQQEHVLIGTDDWVVLGANYSVKKRIRGGANFLMLRQMIWQIIQQQQSSLPRGEKFTTILVDADHGYGISKGLNNMLGKLLFYKMKKGYYNNRSFELNAKFQAECRANVYLKISDGVEKIVWNNDEMQLRFKRFRPIERVPEKYRDLMQQLANKRERGLKMSVLEISQTQLVNLYHSGWIHIFTKPDLSLLGLQPKQEINEHQI